MSPIKPFEACRLNACQDIKGIWTIGYGHAGRDVHPGMVVTQAQAVAYLRADIKAASEVVNPLITWPLGKTSSTLW